jgi:hypothetical protein
MKTLLQIAEEKLASNAGLYLIASYLKNKEFRDDIRAASHIVKASGVITDEDIICCWIAMLAPGKPDYGAIEEYRNDKNYKRLIGVQKVPSSSILRQRIEALSADLTSVLRGFNSAIIAGAFDISKGYKKDDTRYQDAVTIDGQSYAVIDSDVSVLDNSNSKKEGVQWTYKKCDGNAPMFSYIGASGYMLNCELRNGGKHSNAPGTWEYFNESIALARRVTELPLLLVLNSGNDDKKLLDLFERQSTYYVVKRNHRKESVQEWLETAKRTQTPQRQCRDGSTVYYASAHPDITVGEHAHRIRIVIVARERLYDTHGQYLLEPEVMVQSYWTSLSCSELTVEKIYHNHGTMEQYHAELKSDMGVERLPSGKFHANILHLLFSIIAFNLLRRVGMTLLRSEQTPGKRGRRLRLRTVIQGVMYMAGMMIHHSGQVFLRISTHHAWARAFLLESYGLFIGVKRKHTQYRGRAYQGRVPNRNVCGDRMLYTHCF